MCLIFDMSKPFMCLFMCLFFTVGNQSLWCAYFFPSKALCAICWIFLKKAVLCFLGHVLTKNECRKGYCNAKNKGICLPPAFIRNPRVRPLIEIYIFLWMYAFKRRFALIKMSDRYWGVSLCDNYYCMYECDILIED